MVNIFQLFTRKPKSRKVSKMLLDVAGEYIAMGEDESDKQQYLNGAVSAWNIACLKSSKQKKAIQEYRKKYSQMNPSHTSQDCDDAVDNIKLLIKRKNELYPDENVQIAHAKIVTKGNKDHITVASMRPR